ncbi:MAG: MG2 domain-containing protein [Armatimonadetes bacterium]|nr:MG2 domain-containing protein [Armatimonadota bacterium]MDW8122595.1 MG2 domain-containing protein [Armatimonadota bacterium]
MNSQRVVLVLTLLYLTVSLSRFVWLEEPRGRLEGKVVSAATGQVLPNATIFIENEKGQWRRYADQKGRFQVAPLPAGVYTLTAYTFAHQSEGIEFTLGEGKTLSLLVSLSPKDPFLEIVHPQPVFHLQEPLTIAVRGFVPTEELTVRLWRVLCDPSQGPVSDLLSFLDNLRFGWWEGPFNFQHQMRKLQAMLQFVREWSVPISSKDQEGVFFQNVPLEVPAPGIYIAEVRAEQLMRPALVIRTPFGLIVKAGQSPAGRPSVFAIATDLVTGRPLPSVPVQVIAETRQVGRVKDRMIATGRTNSTGVVSFDLSTVNWQQTQTVFVTAHYQGSPVCWVRLDEWDWQGALTPESSLVGFAYTDRPIYRPGDTVRFKGIVRQRTTNGYRLPEKSLSSVNILIRDPDEDLVVKRSCPLSPFGSFSGEVTIPEGRPTGTYSLALLDEPGATIGEFTVASYRKPSVFIRLVPARRFFSRSDKVRVKVVARYGLGMPASHQIVSYMLSRTPVAENEGYYQGYQEGFGELISGLGFAGDVRLDEKGEAILSFDWNGEEATPFTEYECELSAWMKELPEEASATARFRLTQGDWNLAIRCSSPYIYQGEEVTVQAIVRGWEDKKPKEKVIVRWKAGRLVMTGDATEVTWTGPEGQSVTNARGRASWTFQPDQPGDWIVQAIVQDERDNTIGDQEGFWVLPREPGVSRLPSGPAVQIRTDKSTCRVGETIHIVVRSRIPDGYLILSLEGRRLWDLKILPLRDGQTIWSFVFRPEYAPSVDVCAFVVRRKRVGQSERTVAAGSEGYRLRIQMETDKKVYRPREKGRVRITVSDHQGRPIACELSLALVDEGIYSLKEEMPEDLFQAFYGQRTNQVLTRYSFPWLAWQGDKGTVTTVRQYFPDTALWIPHLKTDENGKAEVTFQVPDTLTSWRLSAYAHSPATQLGYQRAAISCTIPFAVQLSAPKVLTIGDKTVIKAVVHNDTDQSVVAQVRLQAEWLGDRQKEGAKNFGSASDLGSQQIHLSPRQSRIVSWSWTPEWVGKWRLVVSGEGDNGLKDAEARTLSVHPHGSYRERTKSLLLRPTEVQAEYRFTLPPYSDESSSFVAVRLAPSVLSAVLGAVDYLAQYPYGCTEQTVNTFLPTLFVWNLLKSRGLSAGRLDEELPKMVTNAIARLSYLQHADGGWGWWEEDESDLMMTALVVRGLSLARQAGFAVPRTMWQQGLEGLSHLLRLKKGNANAIAFSAFALSEAGYPWLPDFPRVFPPLPKRGNGHYQTSLRQWQSFVERFSPEGLAYLTLACLNWGRKKEALELADRLIARSDGLSPHLWWSAENNQWVNQEERTAWCLLAVLKAGRASQEMVVGTVHALLSRRKGIGWTSTKDTAAILEALMEFSRRFETLKPAPLTVRLALNGREREVTLSPLSPWEKETVVLLSDGLRKGNNRLILQKGEGSSLIATIAVHQMLILPEGEGLILSAGAGVKRTYKLLRPPPNGSSRWQQRDLLSGEAVRSGEWLLVTLEGESPWDYWILEDPVPGGCLIPTDHKMLRTIVNADFQLPIEVRDDRILFVQRHRGPFFVQYMMRASVPGDYHILPSRVWPMYGQGNLIGGEHRLRIVP